MKKAFRVLFVLAIIALSVPTTSFASDPNSLPIEHREAQLQKLNERLKEIEAMDIKKLSKEEKKALRGEVKKIKKEMKVVSGGVYLSVGAILLIALLLILLA
ncbi:hypothetical protein [Chryseosolibacter indicus]|uniref:Seryl-tRNA synthetase n=1 Tax=Chryseosolibacter indicus TaxID=2782351 RepID=A0ABS5VMR0_9BACT|nr:hypothetical protein [Chryseosolibacter indicus]MBT1702401.1 hypothetical protein [Chryseosolibacter indicus]